MKKHGAGESAKQRAKRIMAQKKARMQEQRKLEMQQKQQLEAIARDPPAPKPTAVADSGNNEGISSSGGVPADFFDEGMAAASVETEPPTSAAGTLPAGFFDAGVEPPQTVADAKSEPDGQLPPDFFDAGVEPPPVSTTTANEDGGRSDAGPKDDSSSLPQGFFDNKSEDARAQGVDPEQKLKEEYALFQKAIRQEEALQGKAAEEDAEEREISVLEEQTHEQQMLSSRLASLKDRHAKLRQKRPHAAGGGKAPVEPISSRSVFAKKARRSVDDGFDTASLESLVAVQWRAKSVIK